MPEAWMDRSIRHRLFGCGDHDRAENWYVCNEDVVRQRGFDIADVHRHYVIRHNAEHNVAAGPWPYELDDMVTFAPLAIQDERLVADAPPPFSSRCIMCKTSSACSSPRASHMRQSRWTSASRMDAWSTRSAHRATDGM